MKDADIYSAGLKGTGLGAFINSRTSSTERIALSLAQPRKQTPENRKRLLHPADQSRYKSR